jgi:predicted GIY-YIG superfamily endonuclease
VYYFEEHAAAPLAIQREKNIKLWPRTWKVRLIHQEILNGSICTIHCRIGGRR